MSLILSGTDGLSDVDGTAATPAVRGTDTNTGIFFPAADTVAAATGGTERLRLDSSGNLGLGVTPSAWLATSGRKAIEIGALGNALFSNGASDFYMLSNAYRNSASNFIYANNGLASAYQQPDGQHRWYTAPSGTAGNAISFTQAMTLDASGNLGLGTTSPDARLTIASAGRGRWYRSDNARYGDIFMDADGFNVVAQSAGDNLTLGSLNVITFRTASAERARIDSSGNLLVGTTSVLNSGKFSLYQTNNSFAAVVQNTSSGVSGAYGIQVNLTQDPNSTDSFFYKGTGNATDRFYVRANGGIGNYQANDVNLSDRREKTNFAPATSYLDKICAIPVQTFNYIDQNMEDDGGLTLGVVAQDVQAVAPELVMESNWGTEDNPKMRLAIYQTDLQYALMKALQELKAEFDAYKATHP